MLSANGDRPPEGVEPFGEPSLDPLVPPFPLDVAPEVRAADAPDDDWAAPDEELSEDDPERGCDEPDATPDRDPDDPDWVDEDLPVERADAPAV
jgi:hypothetical protein